MTTNPFLLAKHLAKVSKSTLAYELLMDNDESSQEDLVETLQNLIDSSTSALSCLNVSSENIDRGLTDAEAEIRAEVKAQAQSRGLGLDRVKEDLNPKPSRSRRTKAAEAGAAEVNPAASPLASDPFADAFKELEASFSTKEEPRETRVAKKGLIRVFFENGDESIDADPGVSPGIISVIMLRDFAWGKLPDRKDEIVEVQLVNAEDTSHVLSTWYRDEE